MVSCKVKYTFSGADIGEAKTLSVGYIQNKASLVSLTLSNTFTEALKDKFSKETPLALVQQDGDLQFSGIITDYSIAPSALQGSLGAATNRLSIRAKIKFENKLEPKKNFEQEFSSFQDFDANASFSTVENDLVAKITQNMVQDIFTKAVINW